MKKKQPLIDFLKGLPLGLGMLPGVSMATVGFFINVYERLIDAVNGLRHQFKKSIKIVLPMALGVLLTTLLVFLLVNKVLGYVPIIIMSVCAGLTIGGLPIIRKEINDEKLNKYDYLRALIGFIAAAGVGVLSALDKHFNWFSMEEAFLNPNANWWIYIVVPIVGFVAAVACLIPGISGSMVAFVAGVYTPLYELYFGKASMFHKHERIGPGIIITLELAVGILIGVLAISKVMAKLLENHRRGTFSVVIGLVIGSVVAMFVNNSIWPFYTEFTMNDLWQVIVGPIIIIGIAVPMMLIIKKKLTNKETK